MKLFIAVYLFWWLSIKKACCGEVNMHNLGICLTIAAELGDVEKVRELLDSGADVNYGRGYLDIPPLAYAAMNGHFETMKVLLERGANTETMSSWEGRSCPGWTALHYAAEHGDCRMIDLLLSFGANINAVIPRGLDGLTPLHLAVGGGHYDAVRLLLDYKADISTVAQFGRTPLHIAADKGHWDITELLLANGADGSALDRGYGRTPIDISASYMRCATNSAGLRRKYYKTTIVLLRNQRAGSCAKRMLSWSDLHFAAYTGDVQRVVTLVNGENVNAADGMGATPLFYAAFMGHAEIVRILAQAGGRVDVRDLFGQLPLRYAVWNGHYDAVRALMEHGADINVRDRNGDTLLHEATCKGDYVLVGELLKLGADIDAVDSRGLTSFVIAMEHGHFDVMLLFLTEMANRGNG